jgi:DNA repair protein RecO (recombination protein O)
VPTVLDEALLLRRSPFGESSLTVRVLTREHGLVSLMAKGAHRPTSRFFAVLDAFHTLELTWAHVASRDLQTLQAGRVLVLRRRIPRDLERYHLASTVLELAGLAARAGQPDGALFELCRRALDELDAGRLPAPLVLVVFELRFLQNLGLAPALEACAACGGPAETVTRDGRVAFSAGAGGRLCLPCAEEARRSGRRVGTLPADVLAVAARLVRDGAPTEARDAPDSELTERLRDFVGRFMDFHLETRPRTHHAFLSAPNRNAPRATPR